MFNFCTVEALLMRWLKRDIWKAGITFAGMLLLLVLMVWVPVSAAGAYERASGLATPVTATMQTTPTEDATLTALSKEQLTLQVKPLQNQLQNQDNWLEKNAAALIAAVASVTVALFGISQWAINRRDERRKEVETQDKELRDRAEERFKTAVTALGDEKEGTQVVGAILLRSFLNPDDEKIYGRYYTQIFDLAVAHLRLRPIDADKAEPLDSPSQLLITLFKESFPLARNQHTQGIAQQLDAARIRLSIAQRLDAARIQLDNAFLAFADLNQVWIPFAYLREANLHQAHLYQANLHQAHLHQATLNEADLSGATLYRANLYEADLRGANLSGADLSDTANLDTTILRGARYNAKEILVKDPQGKEGKMPPTKWPQGFDPKAAGATEVGTMPGS
jgi:hypothetical protein